MRGPRTCSNCYCHVDDDDSDDGNDTSASPVHEHDPAAGDRDSCCCCCCSYTTRSTSHTPMMMMRREFFRMSAAARLIIFIGALAGCSAAAEHPYHYRHSYYVDASMNTEEKLEYFAENRSRLIHEVDSMILLVFTSLLVVIVLTAWFFKHYRFRFINETGLTLIYGMLFGYLIQFTDIGQIETQTLEVISSNRSRVYEPPDFLRLGVSKADNSVVHFHYEMIEGFFADSQATTQKHVVKKTVFSPEIFFNIILPPVIFNAGYSLKKRHFFRNIGSIFSFVFIGATVSSLVMAFLMYVFCVLFAMNFKFQELLFFGSILSATDPLTVLAVFNEVHVEADIYALIFGESALNDAVAIVMASIVDKYTPGGENEFDLSAIGLAVWAFFRVFTFSLVLGSATGCINALITKFTGICDFPNLETGMFILLSYASFLLAEVVGLTGIVAVLFCGICQAHYTFNNLSLESQNRTKQFFDIVSFLTEAFIFLYIGVAVMTSSAMKWSVPFLFFSLLTMNIARATFVYPLCALLNIKRRPQIPINYQHMIVFAGLRGAVPFALAARNTSTDNRQIMLATTSIIVIFTVLINGGLSSWMIERLGIPCGEHASGKRNGSPRVTSGADEDSSALKNGINRPTLESPSIASSSNNTTSGPNPWDKAFLPRKWYNFDACFMKPLLTNANPTLMETMPSLLRPLARLLTTQKQLDNYTSRIPEGMSSLENLTTEAGIDGSNLRVKYANNQATLL